MVSQERVTLKRVEGGEGWERGEKRRKTLGPCGEKIGSKRDRKEMGWS